MEHLNRHEAKRAYKEQEDIGGIYRFRNKETGWQSELLSTPNLKGLHSKLQFSRNTGICMDKMLEADWNRYGGSVFEIVEVERLKRKPDQDTKEFRKDLADLLALMQGNA